MSLFKKPKKNFRRRVADSDDEENGDDKMEVDDQEDADPPPVVKPAKKEKKKPSSTGMMSGTAGGATQNLLSFDEEGEGEIFKVKKSSRSQKIAKKIKTESRKEKERESTSRFDVPVAAKKTEEKMDVEYQKQKPSQNNGDEMNGDPDDKSFSGSEDYSDSDSESENKKKSHPFKAVLDRGEIPDANLIHMARKRRQMAREMGGSFIPLEEPPKAETKSRLVREEDHDISDPEEDERVSFSANLQARERQKMRDNFLAAEHGSDDSDQESEWERQQIKKGVSIPQVVTEVKTQQPVYDNYSYQPSSSTSSGGGNSTLFTPSTNTGYSMEITPTLPVVIPPTSKDGEDVSVTQLKKVLKDRLVSQGQVHRAHVLEKDRLDEDLETNSKTIIELEGSVEGLEERYKFFQEMRGYVRDLVDCLNEKVPRITNLEERMLNLLRRKSERLVKRRQEDVKDQSAEYNPSVQPALQPMPGNVGHTDNARQRRTAEREARRARRRRTRESQPIGNVHKEGLSTDEEESQSDQTKFTNERDTIIRETSGLFDDVIDEFHRLNRIKTHFEQWKYQHSESYEEAYIGLCLPKLFTPVLRYRLIDWNPLESPGGDFEEMGWYQSLLFYGFKEGEQNKSDDQDNKLMPSLVEKVLLSKLTILAESVWDPLSSQQTKGLTNTIRKIITEYPVSSDSKHVQSMIKAAISRMKRCLDEDVFMPLYPKPVIESRSTSASIFFHRQLWGCIKLFSNIMMWSEILADSTLRELAVDGLLNRYIILGLSSCSFNDCILGSQMLISNLPKYWFGNLDGDSTLPALQNFCRFLVMMATNLEKTTQSKKETRDGVKQLTKLLVNLHAMDHALQLANQHSLQL